MRLYSCVFFRIAVTLELIGISSGITMLPLILLGRNLWLLWRLYDRLRSKATAISDEDLRILFLKQFVSIDQIYAVLFKLDNQHEAMANKKISLQHPVLLLSEAASYLSLKCCLIDAFSLGI